MQIKNIPVVSIEEILGLLTEQQATDVYVCLDSDFTWGDTDYSLITIDKFIESIKHVSGINTTALKMKFDGVYISINT